MDSVINWDDYFLEMLEIVKKRSPDAETQVACIITENNRIKGVGYNGFPAGIDNLPNTRPDKYKWMVHADVNAIINCGGYVRNPKAYITHLPCHRCLGLMWNFGIREIVVPKNRKVFNYTDEDWEVLETLIKHGLVLTIICKNDPPIMVIKSTTSYFSEWMDAPGQTLKRLLSE